MSFTQKNSPGMQTEGTYQQNQPPGNSIMSVPREPSSRIDPEVMAQQLNGIYVVVAEIKSPDDSPRTRRRFYASLKSAQLAVDRAVTNGRDAHLLIGQISIIEGGDASV